MSAVESAIGAVAAETPAAVARTGVGAHAARKWVSLAQVMRDEARNAVAAVPAAAVPAACASRGDDASFETQLALALSLSQAEADAASTPPRSESEVAAPGAPPSTEDADFALALALQEEDADAALRESRHAAACSGGGVVLISRLQQALNAARTSRTRRGERELFSADDADRLPPASSAVGSPSLSSGDARMNAHAARAVLAQVQEAEEDALYRSLAGRGPKAVAGTGGEAGEAGGDGHLQLISKHDSDLAARRNARRIERDLGPVASGDFGEGDTLLRVGPAATTSLRRHMQKQQVKGVAAHGRVEAAHHATSEGVLDSRTRMILFKLVGSGRLAAVAGVAKVGKEAAVYRGVGWNEGLHRSLAAAAAGEGGRGGQRAQVWGEEEEEGAEGSDAEEESDGEECGGGGGGEGFCAPAPADPRLDLETCAGVPGAQPLAGASVASRATTADVGDDDGDVALKIFKQTLNEFRDRRAYMAGDRRYARSKLSHHNPRKLIAMWCEREFKNLVRVHRAGIPSPAPLLLRGHVIVMQFIGRDGWPAPQLREAPVTSARAWLNLYLQTACIMSALYKWAHLVHADLSEYNLLLWRGRVHVIDLGQAVDTSHPHAAEFLAADVRNVTAFFARKGLPVLPEADLLAVVRDVRVAPHPPGVAASGAGAATAYVRTGAVGGTVPAAGSGLGVLQRMHDEAATAEDARRGVVAPVASAVLATSAALDAAGCAGHCGVEADLSEAEAAAVAAEEAEFADADAHGDPFDGDSGPVVRAVLRRFRAAAAAGT